MFGKLKDNPNKAILGILYLFLIYFFIIYLIQFPLLFINTFSIFGLNFPAFQTAQISIGFPVIIIITYFLFIKQDIFKWKDIGFSKGKNGLLSTLSYALGGGLFLVVFNYFTIDYFLLRKNILTNFLEKCVFAPIWEEFLFRALLLTLLELTFLRYLTVKVFEKPGYNEIKKRNTILKTYIFIILVNALLFVYFHGVISSTWILLGGIVMGIVYLRTKSIIAPIIVHSMGNFVTGGFLFLIIDRFL